MRRAAPRPLGSALERLSAQLAPRSTLARVQACWPEVAGPAVAEEAEPVGERAGAVTVACRSAVWAQELALLEADLIRRLNAALGGDESTPGPVTSLRFTVSRPRGDRRR